MKILVIEDQKKMAQFLQSDLVDSGFEVALAFDGETGLELIKRDQFDLVILDVMLPDTSGIELAKKMRTMGFKRPILMVTALSTTKDKVAGLDAGADDYLTKPFSMEELSARVRALLRRNQPSSTENLTSQLSYDELEMDLVSRKVRRKGHEIALTTKEFALLEFLLRNSEKSLDRTQIAEQVWNIHFNSETNFIDVYINMLRKKIDAPFSYRLIQTVVGVGYALKK